ncbi:autotransporter family protein [Limnobaculum xujianqingii]|nr:autotransporter outer membrane beta-barrel domain-containing protein [Limnobaculum xujianqingii]
MAGVNTNETQANGAPNDLSNNPRTNIYAVNAPIDSFGDYVLRATNGGTLTDTLSVLQAVYSDERHGISAEAGSTVRFDNNNVTNLLITTGVITATDGTSITGETPSTGNGIGVISKGTGSSVTLNRNVTIVTNGTQSSGISVDAGGLVDIKGLTKITSAGTGISATSDPSALSKVNLAGGAEISSTQSAIYAKDGSEISIGNSSQLSTLTTTSASDLIALEGTGTTGKLSFINSDLSIANGNAVKATGGEWTSTFTDSKITGDMNVDSGAKLDTTMTGSEFTGKANGGINLQATDSTWKMTDSSTIASLNMANSSVKFAVPTGTTYNRVLTTGSLSGSGDFYIHTELNEGGASTNSDQIHVTGDAEGNHRLFVTGYGNGAYTVDDGIKVVQIDGNSTSQFTLGNGSYVSMGAFDYYLYEGDVAGVDANDWYLRNVAPTPVDPTVPVDPTNPVTPTPTPQDTAKSYRQEVPGYIAAPYVNMLYGYQTIGTLHERMGDTQQFARGSDNKTWGRFGGSHLESKSGRFNYDVDTMFAQFGRDIYQSTTEAGTSVTGGLTVTLGQEHTKAKDKGRTAAGESINTGDITTNAYSIGGYYTRYAQDGGYIDAVTQFTYYDNSYNSRYDADQKSYGAIVSLEAGKPFGVTENWKIEPQGQIAYQYLTSENFSDEISDIKGDDYNGGLARAGIRFFRDQAMDKDSEFFKPYLTLDAVSTIGKDPSVNVGGTDVKADFDSTWWQAGAGMTANATKNTSFYMDAKYLQSFEGDFDGYVVHVGVQGRF